MTSPEPLQQLSQQFSRIATAVDARNARVPDTLAAAHALCAQTASQQTCATKTLLDDLTHRLAVWREVWPRLGQDAGFRTAVSRESSLWAAKLRTESPGPR